MLFKGQLYIGQLISILCELSMDNETHKTDFIREMRDAEPGDFFLCQILPVYLSALCSPTFTPHNFYTDAYSPFLFWVYGNSPGTGGFWPEVPPWSAAMIQDPGPWRVGG